MKLYLTLLLAVTAISGYAQEYDLLIREGHLIDTKNGIDGTMDVAIKDGRISEVQRTISPDKAKKVIEAKGLVVTPGLLDIHSHNFYGTTPNSYLSDGYSAVRPDAFSFRSGVTTLVDVGGAGWRNIEQFKTQVIDRSKTRVLSFLNIVGSGMKGGAVEQNIMDMDPKLTAMAAKSYKDIVVGVKLAHYNGFDWGPTEKAVEAGRLANIPVMIDFGGSEPELSLEKLFLEKLRPGDIFTHTYAHVNGRTPVVNKDGTVLPFVFSAQSKGIIFDVGHGGGSFLFEQAVPATQQDLWPNTISTDLHTGSMNGGMKDITNVMSKFLNLKMPLSKVVNATTWHAAQAIKRPDLGHLSVGALADITVLKILEGDYGFVDTKGKRLNGRQKIQCEMTFKDGKVMYDLNGLASEPWKN